MRCRSIYSWASNQGMKVLTDRCLGDAGHTGQCFDSHGHAWTRVGEWMRLAREAACQPS